MHVPVLKQGDYLIASVQSVLSGGPDAFRIGMPMELELETLRENREGEEVVIFRFRPEAA